MPFAIQDRRDSFKQILQPSMRRLNGFYVKPLIMFYVVFQSNKLEKAIYFANWVYADSDTKKMLLIFLMRVQKPFEFSAKGYLNMNLDTFSRVRKKTKISSLSHLLYSKWL